MAIARAVIDHLAAGPARPRAIVATHCHELATLADIHPAITLLRAAVEADPTGPWFPHWIEPGAAQESYGIAVARLAGLPAADIERATTGAAATAPVSQVLARRLREQR